MDHYSCKSADDRVFGPARSPFALQLGCVSETDVSSAPVASREWLASSLPVDIKCGKGLSAQPIQGFKNTRWSNRIFASLPIIPHPLYVYVGLMTYGVLMLNRQLVEPECCPMAQILYDWLKWTNSTIRWQCIVWRNTATWKRTLNNCSS